MDTVARPCSRYPLRFGESSCEPSRKIMFVACNSGETRWVVIGVRKRTGERLYIAPEEEFRRRIQCKPPDQILHIYKLFASAGTNVIKEGDQTWTSTAIPSLKRSVSLFNASSACRSNISKWLILSRLKNGLVIERWNLRSWISINLFYFEVYSLP